MMSKYKLRYRIEPWDGPPEEPSERVSNHVRRTQNWGYTDNLFIASILDEGPDENGSVLLLEARRQGPPSKEILLLIRSAIDAALGEMT
jgi:hypothetical protein